MQAGKKKRNHLQLSQTTLVMREELSFSKQILTSEFFCFSDKLHITKPTDIETTFLLIC